MEFLLVAKEFCSFNVGNERVEHWEYAVGYKSVKVLTLEDICQGVSCQEVYESHKPQRKNTERATYLAVGYNLVPICVAEEDLKYWEILAYEMTAPLDELRKWLTDSELLECNLNIDPEPLPYEEYADLEVWV